MARLPFLLNSTPKTKSDFMARLPISNIKLNRVGLAAKI